MLREDRAEQMVLRELCRNDLYFFTRYMFEARYKFAWRHAWHHREICNALMRVFWGRTTRLIINIPPRYSKTELAVINFIPWALCQVPDSEFIHVSYSSGLATKNAYGAKTIVESDAYQRLFPEVALSRESKAKNDWHTTAGGVIYANSSMGTITGFGAGKQRDTFGGALIIDDPHKADEAKSDTMRNKVLSNYDETLKSRLNNPSKTPIILIMQRLHEADLSGWLLAGGSGEKWEHLCLPALDEHADPPKALWPGMHDVDQLRVMQKANSYHFAGQYQQRPAPEGGGIFKNEWWRYYKWGNHPKLRRIFQSWDTAFKAKQENDYSVCATWGECERGNLYLLDIIYLKVEYPDLRRHAKSLVMHWRGKGAMLVELVEDKASGQSLIQDMRADLQVPVIAIKKPVDKVECARLAVPMIEAGKVFLPEGHPELSRFLLSHSQFPNALNDDDVDATSQMLNYVSQNIGGMAQVPVGGH